MRRGRFVHRTLLVILICCRALSRISAQSGVDELFKASDAGQRRFDRSSRSEPMEQNAAVYEMSAVDTLPYYPGGETELFKRFHQNDVCRQEPGSQECVSMRVVVTFIVERDGTVTEPRSEREACPPLQAAALCALNNVGLWVPGRSGGKAVRVRMSMPVYYDLR